MTLVYEKVGSIVFLVVLVPLVAVLGSMSWLLVSGLLGHHPR